MMRPFAVLVIFALAGCSAPSPQISSATAQSVTVSASSGFGTGFASEQDIRVTAQRGCEAFGRDAGGVLQVSANDSRRVVQFACIER